MNREEHEAKLMISEEKPAQGSIHFYFMVLISSTILLSWLFHHFLLTIILAYSVFYFIVMKLIAPSLVHTLHDLAAFVPPLNNQCELILSLVEWDLQNFFIVLCSVKYLTSLKYSRRSITAPWSDSCHACHIHQLS